MADRKASQPGSFADLHPAQSEMLRGLTALYLEVPKEIADAVFERVNAGVHEAINTERTACAEVARNYQTANPEGTIGAIARTIAAAIEARTEQERTSLIVRNPAPDAAAPSVPSGTYREIKISAEKK